MTFSEPGRKLSISVNSFGEIILTLWSFFKNETKQTLPRASASDYYVVLNDFLICR